MTFSIFRSLGLGMLIFASFSSSPSYQLKSYGVGSGGTSDSSSTTYTEQASSGEITGQSSGSTNYQTNPSSIQAEQLGVPFAPTLGNGGGTYYNELTFIINPSGDASDTKFSVAVSSNNFATTSYVTAAGTLGSSQFYQTYSAWGSSGGSVITGLTANTNYEVKVAALQGLFTNTEYGPFASVSTVNPSLSFSVSPSSVSLGNLLPGSVITSPTSLNFTFATNAQDGGNVYLAGLNNGLYSNRTGYTIPSVTNNLLTLTQGYGLQATGASQSSGSPFSMVSPFNGTLNNVGAPTTSFQTIFTTAGPTVGGTSTAQIQAEASSTTPSSPDYSDTLTFVAAANF